MSDYSKTWPERIYLYGEDMDLSYENQTGRLSWFEHTLSNHKNIEYIRADIAKEREAKLIKAAYAALNDSGRPHKYEEVNLGICRRAGIEELK